MLHMNFPYGLQEAGDAREPTDQTVCFPLMTGTALHPSFPVFGTGQSALFCNDTLSISLAGLHS